MKTKLLLAVALVSLPLSATALTVDFWVGQLVPDGDSSGLVSEQTVNLTPSGPIRDVDVYLQLTGVGGAGFNGDLYAWLQHDSGFSVLLNRPGRDVGMPFGYGDNGMVARFDDTAPNDIHTYRTSLTGPFPLTSGLNVGNSWKPDGRETDPAYVVTGDPRTALLGSFNGLDPNGIWTLFLADLEPGGQLELTRWGLELQVEAQNPSIVPDGGLPLILSSLVFLALAGVSRAMKLRQNPQV